MKISVKTVVMLLLISVLFAGTAQAMRERDLEEHAFGTPVITGIKIISMIGHREPGLD